jgi:hypothetical protein
VSMDGHATLFCPLGLKNWFRATFSGRTTYS